MARKLALVAIVVAMFSAVGHAQTITICSGEGPDPSGYVTTSFQNSISCPSGNNNQKVLTYIAGDAFGTPIAACNDGTVLPAGWVIVDTSSSLACGNTDPGNTLQLFQTNGAQSLQIETVCNISPVPSGWTVIQTAIDIVPKCGSSEPSRVGEKIENMSNPPPPPPPSPNLASVLQWGAQNPALGHVIGSATSNGSWTVTYPGSQNWLSYGPYAPLSTAGDYVAVWNLSVANKRLGPGMGNIDVNDATTQTQIAVRNPALAEFAAVNTFQPLTLPFSIDSTRAGDNFEFRLFWFDNATTSEAALGYVPLQWNAQDPALGHAIGAADNNTGFPGWSASVGTAANWLQYGPYTTLSQTGTYIALWTLQIDSNYNNGTNEVVAIVDVNDASTQTRLTSLQIHRQDFLANHTDQVFQTPPLTIGSTLAGHQFEFRIWWNDFAYIREQAVGVVKVQ